LSPLKRHRRAIKPIEAEIIDESLGVAKALLKDFFFVNLSLAVTYSLSLQKKDL
jgi:hypothetical protein